MKENNNEVNDGFVIKKRKILKADLKKDLIEQLEDEVVVEQKLQLYVDDKLSVVFTYSPIKIKELIVGHLLTQAVIGNPEEIKHLRIQKRKAKVKLRHTTDANLLNKEKAKRPKASDNLILNPETIMNMVKMLDTKAIIFRRTGGTHVAALFDSKGEVLAFSEDISRHNAMDKVIGEAALKGFDFKRTVLASTGRLSSEIVSKAANVEVPIIVSLASPTDKGIEVAERKGLTIIGFARGKGFNLYTHPERIKKL